MSSSSDEDFARFQECVQEVPTLKLAGETEKNQTNRILPEEYKPFDPKNLRVSSAYQKHVSKHLELLLDETEYVEVKATNKPRKKKKKQKSETEDNKLILLSGLDKPILVSDLDEIQHNPVLKRKCSDFVDDAELNRRANEVAVTPEYILSKEEIKFWAPETKGVVENIETKRNTKKKRRKKKKLTNIQNGAT